MEEKPSGYDNEAAEYELDRVVAKPATGTNSYKDDDTRSIGSHRVIILDANGLLGSQLNSKTDQVDYELRSYHGTPRTSRSRRSSFSATALECPFDHEGEEEEDKKPVKEDVSKEEDLPADTNSLFSRRMTIAGGFLDVALFTSNCEQMKSILEIKDVHMHYELVLGLLITSLVLQAISGLTLFMVGCFVIRNPRDKQRAEILNHITIGLIVLITAINIFISSFTVKGEVLHRCSDCLQRLG